MLTLNKVYENREDLNDFISHYNIHKHDNILLQVFTGNNDIVFIKELVGTIKSLLPEIKMIGTTTSGEIIDGEITEYKTVLSFSIFENTQIAVHASRYTTGSAELAQSLIDQVPNNKKPKVAISFVDGLQVNGETYLNKFTAYDNKLIIAGGLASDNGQFKETMVFTQDDVLNHGAVIALLYNDDLIVHTDAIFGWINIGKTFTITKAKDNIVYEIDHINVVDFYEKYLGKEIVSNLPASALEFPLLIKRGGINIARTIKSVRDNAFVYAGNISLGDKVTFGYGSVDTIIKNGHRIDETVHSNAHESSFIYSCMARKKLLGSDIGLDIQSVTGTSPLSGFFTYGEFFSNIDKLENELLNQTMTILSLSENAVENNSQSSMHNKPSEDYASMAVRALTHFLSVTAKELEDDKKTLELRVEEEVKKNRNKEVLLLQHSRLVQMGEMISMIAHQWRQPLSAISATINTLVLKNDTSAYDKEYQMDRLNNVLKYTQYMSRTIDDFRNFFKVDKVKEKTSIDTMVENVLNIIQTSLESDDIKINTDFNCTQRVSIYANELQQVVLNLIKNAEDVLKERKIVDPEINIFTTYENGSITIGVEDNAGGIEDTIIDNIFDLE